MARSVKEIKDDMTAMWIDQAAVRTAYALDENKTFDEQFSRISLESIWFYVVAFCTWTLEKLFDLHRDEITKAINELKPHSLRWYVNKAKAFMYGKALIPGADVYDTSGMTDERIDEMKVVRYAAAVEKAAIVYLKVAGAGPAPISAEAYEGLKAYIKEIKDAGVVVELINEPAEHFRVRMTVYYDPMVLDISGVSPSGETPVRDTIRRFIRELPFNGEYRNAAMVDALQAVEGVVIPELHLAETSRDGISWEQVNAKATPRAGYYEIYADADMNVTFMPYETVSR